MLWKEVVPAPKSVVRTSIGRTSIGHFGLDQWLLGAFAGRSNRCYVKAGLHALPRPCAALSGTKHR